MQTAALVCIAHASARPSLGLPASDLKTLAYHHGSYSGRAPACMAARRGLSLIRSYVGAGS